MVHKRKGFVWLYCSRVFSVFGESDVCVPELFGGGEFWLKLLNLSLEYYCLKFDCCVIPWWAA